MSEEISSIRYHDWEGARQALALPLSQVRWINVQMNFDQPLAENIRVAMLRAVFDPALPKLLQRQIESPMRMLDNPSCRPVHQLAVYNQEGKPEDFDDRPVGQLNRDFKTVADVVLGINNRLGDEFNVEAYVHHREGIGPNGDDLKIHIAPK